MITVNPSMLFLHVYARKNNMFVETFSYIIVFFTVFFFALFLVVLRHVT